MECTVYIIFVLFFLFTQVVQCRLYVELECPLQVLAVCEHAMRVFSFLVDDVLISLLRQHCCTKQCFYMYFFRPCVIIVILICHLKI
jgi:hypothetical protein